MPTRFDLFRISLVPKNGPSMFSAAESKEQYIRRIFGTEWTFSHYKNEFYYVSLGNAIVSPYLIGRLGRAVEIEHNASPSQQFEKEVMPTWRACTVVIDPTDHSDGQKLSIEQVPQVGKIQTILKRFCAEINERDDSIYDIFISPIFQEGSFYDFVRQHKDPVSYLSITFTRPNGLWSAGKSTSDEVRDISNRTKASKVQTTLTNSHGLDVNSEGVKDAISYAETGSGTVRARTTSGASFHSEHKQRSVVIRESDEMSSGDVEAMATSSPQAILDQ